MSLLQQLEEDKKKLKELEEAAATVTSDEEEKEAQDEESTAPENNPEEKSEAETKAEAKPEPAEEDKVEKPDNTAFFKMRREKAELEKKIRELEEKVKEAKPEQSTEETTPIVVDNGISQEIIREHQIKKASDEFVALENDFKSQVADYEGIANAYKMAVYQSERLENPGASHEQLLEKATFKILQNASKAVNLGLDPVQDLYDKAKALGFKPLTQEKAVEVEGKPEQKKPDLDKVAKNKARSAGTAAAKGAGGEPYLTVQAAAELPVRDFARLSDAEKRSVMERLRGG